MTEPARLVAVVGPGDATPAETGTAEAIGEGLATAGLSVVCGGLGGVMAAACRGHRHAPNRRAGSLTIGLLPGSDPRGGNPWLDVAVPTGLGEGRNLLVARAGLAVVAVGGAYGTLSEIAFALKIGRPVIGVGTWELARGGRADEGVRVASDAAEALAAVRTVVEPGEAPPESD